MSGRWTYVHEGPLNVWEVAAVKGQESQDVWDDLFDGVEERFEPCWDGGRVTYTPIPEPAVTGPAEFDWSQTRLYRMLMSVITRSEVSD